MRAVDAALRPGTPADARGIAALDEAEYGRSSDVPPIARLLERYPSCVAEVGDEMIGFALCGSFAPDILELRQLTVSADHRDRGIGTAILSHLEASVAGRFAWLLVVTSDLYPHGRRPRSRTTVYERAGFEPVLDTGPTRVLAKRAR
jgi:GNAT superfamily N-acetyltransferase